GGGHNVVAHPGNGLDRVGNGRHAGSHGQRTDTTLQGSDPLLQHIVGRIHDPRVDVAGHLEIEQIRPVLGAVERVGCGLVYGTATALVVGSGLYPACIARVSSFILVG